MASNVSSTWVSLLCVCVAGCGGSTRASASGDATPEARDGNGGAGGSVDAGSEARDANGGAIDSGGSGGGAAVSGDASTGYDAATCSRGPALGPPEVVASGRTDLWGIGTSPAGPVWVEQRSDVFLGSTPPKLVSAEVTLWMAFDFTAFGGWFAIASVEPKLGGDDIFVGRVGGGGVVPVCLGSDGSAVMDGSYLYVLWLTSPNTIVRIPLTAAQSCFPDLTSPTYDLGGAPVEAIAVDESRLYAFVFQAVDAGNSQYSIEAFPKAGGRASVLIGGAGQFVYTRATVARQGSFAWSEVSNTGASRAIGVLPRGENAAHTITEADGVSGFSAVDGFAAEGEALAIDAQYVYWATPTGFVKREAICGGAPEVLAQNQDKPIDIAVDDRGVYWLDYGSQPGTGKVMEMKKLNAPSLEAGADASSDASSDASIDADASTDAGVSDASE